MGNLIPGPDNRIQISNSFSYGDNVVRVIPMEVKKLRAILEHDNAKLIKLWRFLACRYIILNKSHMTNFNNLSEEKLQLMCSICDILVYNFNDGKKINL